MKLSLLLLGIILAVLGIIFTGTVIGAAIGIPMMIVGAVIILVSLIWPIRV